MDIAFEHEIRRRAYEIWTACGMNDGEAEHHWLSAEHAVRSEAGEAKTASAKTGPVKASRAKAKAAAPVRPDQSDQAQDGAGQGARDEGSCRESREVQDQDQDSASAPGESIDGGGPLKPTRLFATASERRAASLVWTRNWGM